MLATRQRPWSSTSPTEKSLPRPPPPPDHDPLEMTAILVGAKQHLFSVNKRLLCEASPFFSSRLLLHDFPSKPIRLWLPGESSTMFALFVEYLHAPSPAFFRRYIDERAVSSHDALVRLHLFASHLDLHHLQDLAMDAIQDLYLSQDWDVPDALITYLYTQCEAVPSVRLRRWAVAMVAFALHNHDSCDHGLFESLPAFKADYDTHVRNMLAAGLHVRLKNPQLRIAKNRLRNDQRLVGFRECSFHSHRARVGEGPCPHRVEGPRSASDASSSEPANGPVQAAADEGLRPRPRPGPRHVRSVSSGLWNG